ncbi:MAG: hypothetical protein Q9162_004136 [Coniocarpon cinnabarinum]
MSAARETRTVNCLQCAKRKVRCDRAEPCSHCRRRKEDCTYPPPYVAPKNWAFKQWNSPALEERVGKLEDYIRSLGVDPNRAVDPSQGVSTHGGSTTGSEGQRDVLGTTPNASSTSADAHQFTPGSTPRSQPQLGTLRESEEGSSYVETPMWLSWADATKFGEGNDDQETLLDDMHQQSKSALGSCSVLMNPGYLHNGAQPYKVYPNENQIWFLWRKFLINVHPLTKTILAWDKEYIMRKAAHDVQTLSISQEVFMFAVSLITTLSLSDAECSSAMQQPKNFLLEKFQQSTEICLVHAQFIMTSDCLVLQALMYYLAAMQNRARPYALFSIAGIAVRIAERLGIHRDGEHLNLPIAQAEERRRIWWHLQHMEITNGRMTGTLPMTLWASWDCKMPSNLEDEDIHPALTHLPPERAGLTNRPPREVPAVLRATEPTARPYADINPDVLLGGAEELATAPIDEREDF